MIRECGSSGALFRDGGAHTSRGRQRVLLLCFMICSIVGCKPDGKRARLHSWTVRDGNRQPGAYTRTRPYAARMVAWLMVLIRRVRCPRTSSWLMACWQVAPSRCGSKRGLPGACELGYTLGESWSAGGSLNGHSCGRRSVEFAHLQGW